MSANNAVDIKTIFLDIDGCIFKHPGKDIFIDMCTNPDGTGYGPEILPGSREKIFEWLAKGYMIILTTGRPNSLEEITKSQLTNAGIPYHKLIMGLPRGTRVVINDAKPEGLVRTTRDYTVTRNSGLGSISEEI